MPSSDNLAIVLAGLADMDKGLMASMGGAKLAADCEDLPSQARAPLREAVRAVEFARKKSAEAVAAVAAARKSMESRVAS